MILETFAVYFTFATPANPLPDLEIGHPQGALALATSAANIFYLLLPSYFFLTPPIGRTFSLPIP